MSGLAERAVAALERDGPIADELPGYEPRPGQLAMAARVAAALENDERLLCEAGTGTGKTLAYLVPAILSGRKVVITTGTKTLQDQIARVDLPRLRAALPDEFTFAVTKGLSNYVCLRRLEEHERLLALPGRSDAHAEALRAWVKATESGDRADLATVPDEALLWREVTSAPETRLGARCVHYDRCFVTNMRRRAASASIVLANHHLFFADLALRSRHPEAQVLPPYEVVIFDEAHQVEDVATEFFGLHVSSHRLFALARDASRAPLPRGAAERGLLLGRHLHGLTEALAVALRDRLPAPRDGLDEIRVPIPSDLFARGPAHGALARYLALDAVLEEVAAFFARHADPPSEGLYPAEQPSAAVAAVLGGLARRARFVRDELAQLVDTAGRDHVRWLSASARNVSLRSSPIDVAPRLREAFDAHPGALVFTSATLSVAGGFGYVRERLGLGDTAAEAVFPSPFRWSRQALIYLPGDLPDPNDDRFARAAAARMVELCHLSQGRALLLFTSFRNLRIAEAALRTDGCLPLLVQGESPRHNLLERLRREKGAVLLASQSFWEGVDVPGDALSLVVMDRVPFAVPEEPLVAARIARVREEGGDPFGTLQLPQAALALRQGFGRLVRTTHDRGVVAVLDGRLLRKQYGATLLAALPRECARTEDLDDVGAFFSQLRPAAHVAS